AGTPSARRRAGAASASSDALADRAWTDVLVAVDVGTSGARAAAFDLDGHRRLEVRRSYPTRSPRPGWAEQDPLAWRAASIAALAGLVRAVGPRRRVLGIGLTGQCPTVCLVDDRHRPLGPGLLYRDNRATAEAAWIRERLGDVAVHRRTGHLPAAFHIAPKLMWLRDHEPELFARARLALQPRDLVALALTGEPATDGTHAAATLAFDLRRGDWDPGLIESLELPAALFPSVRPSWAAVGALRPSVATRLGLPAATAVVLGGADSQACALGAAVVSPGPVSEMAGSSTCLNAAVPQPLDEPRVTHYPHVVPGPFTTETGINTSGAAVAWFAALAYGGRRGRATTADYARLDAEVAAVEPGADGLLALPTLADGERTDPGLRGALTGLSLRHGRAEVARAILESVAYEIRDQLALLTRGGAPVTELRVSGGDTRLGSWNRIKADVTGLPVATIPGDAAVTGVAMLAGLGASVYRDVDEAIARCVRPEASIEPDASAARRYDEGFATWRELLSASVVRRDGG
ncbi:MAG TPA: FGGY family carbohydrate kinase, partial [Candidatus Dormibacteraeota bacterium]|nr:FGGY family carbohydrate kinase [Candidatus Dormibacteraeota bacterium]